MTDLNQDHGDFVYEGHGADYGEIRRSDPRIASRIDARLSILSVHHWTNRIQGLREMRRVARGPVVVLSFDPTALRNWWLEDYGPEVFDVESKRYPSIDMLESELAGQLTVEAVPTATDCSDGFSEAYYAGPEAFLDPRVISARSAWSFVPPAVIERLQTELRTDLRSDAWEQRYEDWRQRPEYTGAVRIMTSR